MARFTCSNVLLPWLTIVIPCLMYGRLDALPVAEENEVTVNTTIYSAIENSTDPNACTMDEFRCDDSECIGKGLVCDGEKHCSDGSDENYKMCKERECYPEAPFKCAKSGQCIPSAWVCDGEDDCIFNDDENLELCQPSTPPTVEDLDDEINVQPDEMLFRDMEFQQPSPHRNPIKRPPPPPPPTRPPNRGTPSPFEPYYPPEPDTYPFH